MALHLLKLIWNRKRANFLIITEILLSFLVLAAVTTVAVHYWRNYQAPLGFSVDRIWDVVVRVPRGIDATPAVERERLARFNRLIDTVRQMPEVESVSHVLMPSFRNWQWNSEVTLADGREVPYNGNRAGDELAETLSVRVIDGRWFSREDTGQSYEAVVLNAAMAKAVFGDARAVGQDVPVQFQPGAQPGPPPRKQRVVGVVEDYRQFGEYSTPGNYMLVRNDIVTEALPRAAANTTAGPAPAPAAEAGGAAAATPPADAGAKAGTAPAEERVEADLPSAIVLRVKPGVGAEFEERLVKALQATAPDWGFTMKAVEDVRADYLRDNYLTPLLIMGMVAGFLLLMVALGLSGVLWQNVTQRIRELGLRRAKGADRARIKLQIFMELALMTGIAIGLGAIILAQLPMFGWLGPVPPGLYAASLVLAAALLFVLTSFCGWYPSLLATRIPPAEALRYE